MGRQVRVAAEVFGGAHRAQVRRLLRPLPPQLQVQERHRLQRVCGVCGGTRGGGC